MESAANDPPLRVLHVLSNLGVGGAEVWLLALLRYFRDHAKELGATVQTDIFLTHGVEDRLDGEARSLGAHLHYARYSRTTMPAFVSAWRRCLSRGGYAAIHDHQEFSAGWHFALGAGRLPPVRIAHLHNPVSHLDRYTSAGTLRRLTVALGNRGIACFATHLLSTSRQLIADQGYHRFLQPGKLRTRALYCGFDPSRFDRDRAEARRSVRAEFGWPDDSRLLLFVGRLDSHHDESQNQKNPGFCLEVMRACAQRDPGVVALVAGGGESVRRRLEERVAAWDLPSRIRLPGARDDVPRLMAAADLLLMPSLGEGLGMVAVEAQAAGLPVLASTAVPRECAVVESLVRFAPLEDGAASWSDAIFQVLAAPPVDRDRAHQLVADSPFSIAHSARELLSIYRGHD